MTRNSRSKVLVRSGKDRRSCSRDDQVTPAQQRDGHSRSFKSRIRVLCLPLKIITTTAQRAYEPATPVRALLHTGHISRPSPKPAGRGFHGNPQETEARAGAAQPEPGQGTATAPFLPAAPPQPRDTDTSSRGGSNKQVQRKQKQ